MPVNFPDVTLSIIAADSVVGIPDGRALAVGQKLALGSAPAGVLVQDIADDGSEDALFGARSHLAGIVRNFKLDNKTTEIDVIPLDDPVGSVLGKGYIDITGTATADAEIVFVIISEQICKITVNIATGEDAVAINAKITAAINATPTATFTPVTIAGPGDSRIALETAQKGVVANGPGISLEGGVPGVSFDLSYFRSGTGVPDLTGVFDAIGGQRYTTIIWPSSYPLDEVKELLDSRFNSQNAVLDGVALQTKIDTPTNLRTYAAAVNSQSIVVIGQRLTDDDYHSGGSIIEHPDHIAAQVGAVRELRLTTGAPLTRYLTTSAESDQFGGPAIASLPYANTALPQLPVSLPKYDLSEPDARELRDSGVGVIGPNRVYNGTIMGELVTTYLTDNAGNPDDSFKYLNTVDTESKIRELYYLNLKKRFGQSRATNGGLSPGRDLVNVPLMRAVCKSIFQLLSSPEYTLTASGAAALEDYDENLQVSLELRTGTFTINQKPLIVGQLRAIIGTIKVNFGG